MEPTPIAFYTPGVNVHIQNVIDRIASGADNPLQVVVELLLIGLAVNWCAGVLHGTRGTRLLRGLLVLLVVATLVVRVLATSQGWARLELLYNYFLIGLAFIALVAFQPELRRALIRAGDVGFFRRVTPQQKVIAALVETAGYLSRNKYGGLIAIQREIGLANWAENGTTINAEVTADLLKAIFFPNNPLHDLGVIVRDTRVRAANCQFPVAESGEVDGSLGSRHRAAIGLSSESDALVLVVSEETGTISLADSGRLVRFLSLDDLGEELVQRLSATRRRNGPRASLSDFWRHARRFLVVAPLAVVIWFLADQASLTRSEDIRVQVRILHDADRHVEVQTPRTRTLRLTVRGSKRQVDQLVARTAIEALPVNWRLVEPYNQTGSYAPEGPALLEILRSTSELQAFDVVIEEAAPPTLSFVVEQVLTFPAVPVVVTGQGRSVEVTEISTPRVKARLRASEAAKLGDTEPTLQLDLTDRLQSLAAGAVQRFSGIPLPLRIGAAELLEVDPRMVDLAVRIVAEQAQRRLEQIPVELRVSPQVLDRVTIERQDKLEWLLAVEVEGDRRTIAELDPARIRGVVRLEISEVIPGSEFRTYEVDLPLPEGVRLVGPPPTVQLRFKAREGTGP